MGWLKHHNMLQCSIHNLGSLEEKDPCAQYQMYISRCKKCMYLDVRKVSWVMSKVSRPSQGKTMENNGLRDKRKRLNHYWYDHHFWYIQYQPIAIQLSKTNNNQWKGMDIRGGTCKYLESKLEIHMWKTGTFKNSCFCQLKTSLQAFKLH